jgi:circadian clock protein KaiC
MNASKLEKIPTGVPGLDNLLLGGIPAGRATLIAGRSGTGKSVMALQMAAALARAGHPAILLAVEEAPEDLIHSGDSFGLDLSGLKRDGALIVADLNRPSEGAVIESGDSDLFGLVHRVESLVASHGARAVVLDSATALFSPRPSEERMRQHFFHIISSFRRLELTSIVIAESQEDYGSLTTLGVEDFVCDLTMVLRNVMDGGRRRRSIEINKYRRSPHFKGEYPCTITTKGLAVFPVDAKEYPADYVEMERFSSGVEGLDEMTSGGWLRNSIIIVRGPTGAGKTILAGVYAKAGSERGERVVYYGFEETRATLLRNYRELGMDLQPLVDAGNLRVVCRYPEATSLEDLLVDLRIDLEEYKPSLIVLDSISSIEHASSERGFRQFMIGVASILRQHGRSALITQTVLAGTSAGHAAPYLSTIADAILALDYDPSGYALDRTMRVIKSRGSAHAPHPYRLDIDGDGIHVTKMSPSDVQHHTRRASDRRIQA